MKRYLSIMAAGLLLGLSGCGFQLRGLASVPVTVQPLYLHCGTVPALLCKSLRTQLSRNEVATSESTLDAYQLKLSDLTSERRASAVDLRGTAEEFDVRMLVNVTLVAPDGLVLINEAAVRASETFRSDENNALGSRREEQSLNETLYGRLSQQILRRLSVLNSAKIDRIRQDAQTAPAPAAAP